MFCPKRGCVPSTHTANPPSSPSAHFILVCGFQLIPGLRIILPVPAVRVTGTSVPVRSGGETSPPHCSPPTCPQPQHHHPQFLKPSQTGHIPSGRAVRGQWSRGMGSLERAARVTPLLSPPSAGAGQEQNFPSGKMFVCVCWRMEEGLCCKHWSCLMTLMCLGYGGAVIPSQTPPLRSHPPSQGVWIC